MKMKTIRFVKETDAAEILEIYEPYIKKTAITFECETPSLDEFRNRIKEISSYYPYIVCVLDGKIIGYAYAHRQMERAAYQWNAELSVYIYKTCLRCGVGKALYSALIEILQMQNVHNVYGGVTYPNENSERLHKHFGFKKLDIYHNTGYKCGAWHDVAWFEKNIGDYDLDPNPFISIQEIDKNMIIEILNRHNKLLLSI
ncbi:GNAT family N-acetyltransferase [uncultured Clostridium sp.]|uniref:GNAT family N-acetyltransferase n=1 Tax=uncultured Clostridium sp. TaxID=59620 RepID=UPI0028EBD509|nr:GNAT family N-acetyltransferase [uncultured Clostridium sp.]